MVTKITEYKGRPIFGIYKTTEETYPVVSFGLEKAKVILAHIDGIKSFVLTAGKETHNDKQRVR